MPPSIFLSFTNTSVAINNVDDIIRNKPCLMVLTKKDLCDENETKKWVKYYEEQGKLVAFVDLKSHSDYKVLISDTKSNHYLKLVGEELVAGYFNGKRVKLRTNA